MACISGHRGRVLVRNVALRCTRWSVTWRVDVLDVSNFENFDWGRYTDGVLDFDVSCDAIWDTADDPFAVVQVRPGNTVSMDLLLDRGGNEFHFESVLLSSVRNDQSVRDVVRYSFEGKVTVYSAADQPVTFTSTS